MIGYIKGKVLYTVDNVVVIENNGIGYEVSCSSSAFAKLVNDNQGEVYTYMAVREDGVNLYGFISPEEKSMFLKLLTVTGVGPKMAVGILSNMSLDNLAIMIATSDVKGLSKVKGLGKKTAEKIIVELRGGLPMEEEVVVSTIESDEALQALMSLGYDKNTSVKAIKQAKENGAVTLEDIITYALRSML